LKIKFYIVLGLAAVFGIGFAFNLHAYIRRLADTQEIIRQADISRNESIQSLRYIFSNEEIVAHINIPATNISYAITQGADNEFYLYHDLLKQPNGNGSIFLDYLNSPCFTDKSTIIYGHNREDGTMFHDLQLFQDYDFFQENRYIILNTMEGTLYYKIFAVFTAHISFNYIIVDFADSYAFLALVEEMKDRAMHQREVEINADDRILILSTCTRLGLTGRLVLLGLKIS